MRNTECRLFVGDVRAGSSLPGVGQLGVDPATECVAGTHVVIVARTVAPERLTDRPNRPVGGRRNFYPQRYEEAEMAASQRAG